MYDDALHAFVLYFNPVLFNDTYGINSSRLESHEI